MLIFNGCKALTRAYSKPSPDRFGLSVQSEAPHPSTPLSAYAFGYSRRFTII